MYHILDYYLPVIFSHTFCGTYFSINKCKTKQILKQCLNFKPKRLQTPIYFHENLKLIKFEFFYC